MGEHKSWIDRLFSLCISFLIAAIAIHVGVGVGLIRTVWTTLLAIAALGTVIVLIMGFVRRRNERW